MSIRVEIGIYDGDVLSECFDSVEDLLSYIDEFTMFEKRVWIVVDETGFDIVPYSEQILITENIEVIKKAIASGSFKFRTDDKPSLYIQEYENYVDAFAVAMMMLDTNPLYNREQN